MAMAPNLTEPISMENYRRWSIRLQDAYFDIFESEVDTKDLDPKKAYEKLLVNIRGNLKDVEKFKKLVEYLQNAGVATGGKTPPVAIDEFVEQSKKRSGVDDISPNDFKHAIYAIAAATNANVPDIPMRTFLKAVVKSIWTKKGWGTRINIVSSRNFPRMYQWLCEVETETHRPTGQGFKIMNASRRGSVAAEPGNPDKLIVRINRDFL